MRFNNTDLLLEAGNLFHKAKSDKEFYETIVEYANSALQPDLCCFYLYEKLNNSLKLTIKKGFAAVPKILSGQSELVIFLEESKELVCLNTRKQSPFSELLLSEKMESGLAVPLFFGEEKSGILIVNSIRPFYFKSREISFLENIRLVATPLLLASESYRKDEVLRNDLSNQRRVL